MGTGAITQYVDVAQLVLYLFWIFFAGLVYYLTVESKREGFPLETDRTDGRIRYDNGIAGMPRQKVYKTAFHGDFLAPHGRDQQELPVQGKSFDGLPYLPLEPTGDPMTSGIGPGAFTQRSTKPDMTAEGHVRIVPLREAPGFSLAEQDLDPRGLPVLGADGQQGGTVTDVWVDRSEHLIRYLELQTSGGRQVLVPMNFARIHRDRIKGNRVTVQAVLAGQFEGVPGLSQPGQISRLEEEKVMGYFGAGTLFATPDRREPLI
ncbi:MAG: photosynthetic reaction center subunit H [Burkholderiaceae bacterium]|jgi:photosynthetic reaction center H subunit